MSRHPLPPIAVALLGLQAGPGDREAYLGDVAEEYARRRARGGSEAEQWLTGEVLSGAVAWARYRLPRSRTVGALTGVVLAFVATAAAFALLNLEPVLEAVRALPAGTRVPVAVAANLLAVGAGGAVAGALETRGPGLVLVLAGTFAWAWAAASGPAAYAVAWGVTSAASAAAGYACVRWTRGRRATG